MTVQLKHTPHSLVHVLTPAGQVIILNLTGLRRITSFVAGIFHDNSLKISRTFHINRGLLQQRNRLFSCDVCLIARYFDDKRITQNLNCMVRS